MNLAIDFGTSFTKIAYMDDVFINLTAKGVPSVFAHMTEKDQLVFGYKALQLKGPGINLFPSFKLKLKRKLDFSVGSYNLAEILYHFFAFLDNQYVKAANVDFRSVSLAVPNYFGLRARSLLIKALKRLYPQASIFLVPEPVAALVGHILVNQNKELDGDVLVIDMGGGTSDFSFLTFSSDSKEIIIESQLQMGQDVFSGWEIDRAILNNILLPQIKKDVEVKNLTPYYKSLLRLAEGMKIGDSNYGHHYINEPDIYPGYTLKAEFDAEQILEVMATPLARLGQYFNKEIVNKAKKLGFYEGFWEIDKVLLLGGSSQTVGIYNFWTNLLTPIPVKSPPDKTLNVVKGLAIWPKIMDTSINVKTIYPFNFYIQTVEQGEYNLEPIHFDTAMLELDIKGQYKIFTFPVDSIYNLSARKDMLKCKIYEIEEESEINLDRFRGQEIILDLELPNYGYKQNIEIKLDFSTAQLSAEYAPSTYETPHLADNLLTNYVFEQDWLSHIKQVDLFTSEFNRDLSDFLAKKDLSASEPLNGQIEFIRFKLLALLNYIS